MLANNILDPTTVMPFITGAGGGLIIGYLFIRSLQKDKDDLKEDVKLERSVNKEIGDALLQLSAEMKLHMIHVPKSVEELEVKLIAEHVTTRGIVQSEIGGLRHVPK